MKPEGSLRPTIVAYADDSINPDVIVAAGAIFSADRNADAEACLARAKADFGVPPHIPLHCRVMFSGDQRRGTPWQRVHPERIDEMIVNLCGDLKQIAHQPIVCVINRADVPLAAFAADPVIGEMHEKRLASFAYQSVFDPLVRRFGGGAVRVYIDPDKTMIAVGAMGHRKAERTRALSIDLGAGQEPYEFEPEVPGEPKPSLLQVADVYAWVTARAHSPSGGRRTRWCQEVYRIIEPLRGVFEWAPDIRWHDAEGRETPPPSA